jgi:hypothetical protein
VSQDFYTMPVLYWIWNAIQTYRNQYHREPRKVIITSAAHFSLLADDRLPQTYVKRSTLQAVHIEMDDRETVCKLIGRDSEEIEL